MSSRNITVIDEERRWNTFSSLILFSFSIPFLLTVSNRKTTKIWLRKETRRKAVSSCTNTTTYRHHVWLVYSYTHFPQKIVRTNSTLLFYKKRVFLDRKVSWKLIYFTKVERNTKCRCVLEEKSWKDHYCLFLLHFSKGGKTKINVFFFSLVYFYRIPIVST